MNRVDIDKKYIQEVLKFNRDNVERYKKMMKEVGESTAIYKGEPIPFLPMPKMYAAEDEVAFEKISSTMMGILKKVIDRYVEDEEFRGEFQFHEVLEKLILKEHGYSAAVPMARIDIFYHGPEEFKFCELNADGSSAMNEDREISRIFKENGVFEYMEGELYPDNFELFNSWVSQCESIYDEFGGVKREGTTVAIVDWAGGGTVNEFEIFKKSFEDRGFFTVIADPRELKYRDGSMYYEDKKIDIIYRRLVTREIIDRMDELGEFIKGCLESDVCMIGPIKSQIIHNKKIFKILHDQKTKEFLSSEECSFIEKHIPKTLYFKEGIELQSFIEEKDGWILKPCDLYASRGVYAGADYSKEEWKKILLECIGDDYLIQEYYKPHRCEMLELQGEEIVVGEFNNITGIYMYNEKFAGLYSRVGKNPIISGLHDCYTLPSFIIRKK